MSLVSPLLKPVHQVSEAPPDSFLLYSLSGGIFHLPPPDYNSFALQWVGLSHVPPLTLDLTSTPAHAVFLDLDFKSDQPAVTLSPHTLNLIESILKLQLLPNVSNFTYILCCRANHGGIHVHLPEFRIGHDDYVLWCQSLQETFRHSLPNGAEYVLDIVGNVMLPGAAKPKTRPYVPILLAYVDEKVSIKVNLSSADFKEAKSLFKPRKDNSQSLFRSLMNCCGSPMFNQELKLATLPVALRSIHTLTYHTVIGRLPASNSHDLQDVAQIDFQNGETQFIVKGKQLLFSGMHLLRCYFYLKMNVGQIQTVETNNHAIKTWFKRFLAIEGESNMVGIPEKFHDIHYLLRKEHPILSREANPLKTVMEYNEGYFFLPIFYALCRHFAIPATEVVQNVRSFIDEKYQPLLDKLQTLDARQIPFVLTDMSLNTLHFCCSNMYAKPNRMRDKLKIIVRNNERAILSATTQDQIVELVRHLQERHFPIHMLKLRNNLKKPMRHVWNCLTESWQEVASTGEISDHLTNLWNHIRSFLIDYRQSGGLGGPDEAMFEKFSLASVVAAISSDSSMERLEVQMDSHKWFIRLKDGTLDLLTGHIGGVVPEFFMSDRRMGLDVSRDGMIELLCCRPTTLETLYEYLVDKTFFLRFVKSLFTDMSETIYDSAFVLAQERLPDVVKDPMALSMLHFFVNIALYMSFSYDMYMYLMDVLASAFIATNYERKFIVCKGVTSNGKSMLFEILKAVFGGYFVGIQSENLMPVTSGNNATPELASSLFSARIVTCEELEGKLNENRVKQITGNSHVTFRNMYEQNAGGIPTAKVFANTNNFPDCRASVAFRDRTIAIPFEANFVDSPPPSTSEQIKKNQYSKLTNVIEQSYQGCFLMLYYHLKRFMDVRDGFLHYRDEPPYVKEFTKEYLIHTDVYVQFKIHMDVQLAEDCVTNMTQLKSAIRQFLKAIKSTSIHETDLLMRFEDEFRTHRKTDDRWRQHPHESLFDGEPEQLQFSSHHFDEEVPPPTLKRKMSVEKSKPSKRRKREVKELVYYNGIVIKNLKQSTT